MGLRFRVEDSLAGHEGDANVEINIRPLNGPAGGAYPEALMPQLRNFAADFGEIMEDLVRYAIEYQRETPN